MLQPDRLPFPLARLWHEMVQEPDPGKKFRCLIRVFVGFLKGISLVAVSEYLEGSTTSNEVDELLVGVAFERPSLGHWNHFLRVILEHRREAGQAGRIPGLLEFYFRPGTGKPKPTRNVERINAFISLRNEYIHPDIEPEPAVAERLVATHMPILGELIEAAGFLSECPLLLATEQGTLECTGGATEAFLTRPRDERLRPGRFYLATESEPLHLLTFLLFGPPENRGAGSDGQRDDILLYEGKAGKKVKFLSGSSMRYVERSGFRDVDQLLEDIKKRLGQDDRAVHEEFKKRNTEEPSWQRLVKFCTDSSRKMVQFHRNERKFHPDLYQPRPVLEAEYWRFVESRERLAFFVGDSGCGKTNLFCQLTEESLKQGHAVLHFYGRSYGGGAYTQAVAQELVVDENALVPYLQALAPSAEIRAGRRLVIFVDAVNEYHDPAALLKAILEMDAQFAGGGIEFVRLLVSMRSGCWRQIERKGDFRRGTVHFAADPGGKGEQPFVTIGRFTREETEAAYQRYVRKPGDSESHRLLQDHFAIRLETPYSRLPASLRQLVANPIFLKALAQSFQQVAGDVSPADVLLTYFDTNVPVRHRYFLEYFLRALWAKRSDFLTDEEIVALAAQGDWQEKLAEYYTENPVNDVLERFQCSDRACAMAGKEDLRAEQLRDGACPLCGSPEGFPLRTVRPPVKSTFFFLVDEGILSVFHSGEGDERLTLVRFTYDRFFEIMMARHLLGQFLTAGAAPERVVLLDGWLEGTERPREYDDVLVNLLVLSFDRRTIAEPMDPKGILQALERVTGRTEELLVIVRGALASPEPRRVNLVSAALQQLGRSVESRPGVEAILTGLCDTLETKGLDARGQLGLARVVLETARAIRLPEPFIRVSRHSDPTVRMQAAVQTYFLWTVDRDMALDLIENAFSRLFFLAGVPRPRVLEYVLGASLIILFGHPDEQATVKRLLGLGASMTRRMGWLLRLVAWFLPAFVEKILQDIPSDYNPLNLTELRLSKALYRRDPELRAVAVEYAGMVRQAAFDRRRQRELCLRIIERWPGDPFIVVIHQLVQGMAASQDLDSTVTLEAELATAARRSGSLHWANACCYNLYWLDSGGRQAGDEAFAAARAYWEEVLEQGPYRNHCLCDQSYLWWHVVGLGLSYVRRRGSFRVEELQRAFERVLASGDADGTAAFLRGLEITGAEIGTGEPRAVRLVLALVEHVLTCGVRLEDAHLESLARTLGRMQVVHPEDVALLLADLPSTPELRRLKQLVAASEQRENLGTWIGQRGQVFYLSALGIPFWQDFFANLATSFATSKSLAATMRHVISGLLEALRDCEGARQA